MTLTHPLAYCFLLCCTYLNAAAALPEVGSVTNISRFGSKPSWSPDSRRIAFSDTNSPGVWVYDRTTGETRHICSSGSHPAWSPKGDQIAFRKGTSLWLIRPDGTHPVNTGAPIGFGLRWSPDARHLSAHSEMRGPPHHLMIYETTTWTAKEALWAGTEVARKYPLEESNRRVGYEPSWTPEGNLLVTPPVGDTISWRSNEVREYSLDGKLVGRAVIEGAPAKPFYARVSPNGRFMLFERGSRGIWVAARDGSEFRQLSSVGAAAAWSPDGKCIAFDDSSTTPDFRNGIFVMELKLPDK